MNIVYATRATIPYASAASLNAVQMCESLADLDHRVTLAIGRKFWRRSVVNIDWSQYYGFRPRFDVTRIWEIPRLGWGFDGSIWRLAKRQGALLYLRYPRLLAHRLAGGVPALLEIHSQVSSRECRQIVAALARGRLMGVVVITAALRDHLLRQPDLSPFADRLFVAPDAVSWQRFAHVPGRSISNNWVTWEDYFLAKEWNKSRRSQRCDPS